MKRLAILLAILFAVGSYASERSYMMKMDLHIMPAACKLDVRATDDGWRNFGVRFVFEGLRMGAPNQILADYFFEPGKVKLTVSPSLLTDDGWKKVTTVYFVSDGRRTNLQLHQIEHADKVYERHILENPDIDEISSGIAAGKISFHLVTEGGKLISYPLRHGDADTYFGLFRGCLDYEAHPRPLEEWWSFYYLQETPELKTE